MKESEFLGPLMATHPDLFPIVQDMRKKYNLLEIGRECKPITEYIGGMKSGQAWKAGTFAYMATVLPGGRGFEGHPLRRAGTSPKSEIGGLVTLKFSGVGFGGGREGGGVVRRMLHVRYEEMKAS